MRYYFAPLEGVTDSVYRRLHHQFFGGVDSYFMPFLSPTIHRTLSHKEDRELPNADSVPFRAVPQVLTRLAPDFLWAAEVCRDRGYDEVNLNVGCPSGTVVAKGKGAGMLADPAALDRFLDAVFSDAPLPISVKTRLGIADPNEFPALLEVFNRYPIKELTIHPRVRKQFYNGDVELDMFRYAVENSKTPLCYNGNLNSKLDCEIFAAAFPEIDAVMLGRGLVADPGMLLPGGTKVDTLKAFHDALLEEYLILFGGSRNAMFRLKENWSFLFNRFAECDKLAKRLRKTTDLNEYRAITAEIFATVPLIKMHR
ncbi:MAG: tRNA-dihydrouridine synthase family protein [Ruminococcaceae bacterium]|nr:tRNA-dihydrouridine synthase family protein [Oscillospiraceae bacterium]